MSAASASIDVVYERTYAMLHAVVRVCNVIEEVVRGGKRDENSERD